MRGEDKAASASLEQELGSPPHARGRRFGAVRDGIAQGITPACAGKTRRHLLRDRCETDHPRMRGEDS